MNVTFSTGNIGTDAVTRQAGNSKVTNFALGVSVGFGDNKKTVWLDCNMWGARGEKLQPSLTKGTKVAVVGSWEQQEYTKSDGTVNKKIAVNVQELEFIGDNKQQAQSKPTPPPQQQAQAPVDVSDIPF